MEDLNKQIGNRIRLLRENAKEYQKETASKIGIAEGALGTYENGTRRTPPNIISALAKHFNTTSDYILCLTDVRNIMDTPIQIAASTKNGLDLSEICEEDKQTIMNIYQMMKDKNKKD